MARPRPNSNDVVIPSTALVASAIRLDAKSTRLFHTKKGTWQAECYRHFRICGEAQYAANYMGNAVSRATLGIVNDKGEPVTSGPAVDALDALFNGTNGQSQMLHDIAVHLTIAGECYLIGRTVKGVDVWEVVSVLEIEVIGKKWKLKYSDDSLGDVELSEKDVVIRIWNPMPGDRMDANSPFRSLLPILTEIEWLTSHIFSQVRSALRLAGILFLPKGMTFPPPPPVDGKEVETVNEADAFMKVLATGMERALRREGLPEEIAPLVVMADGEDIQATKLMDFWTELDSEAKELRGEAIRRFALGMCLPPEEVLGMSSNGGTGGGRTNGVSHWGAWQIEESTIKMHVEPCLDTIVNALTIGYIRPLLDEGATERVSYDTSMLKLRPDRSQESLELWDRGLIKGSVVVRENGFEAEADMPNDNELVIWLLRKVASGSATPEQVGRALSALGVQGMEDLPSEEIEVTREARPAPSLEEHPSRPRTPEESSLLYASDALVLRAMELAGKRAINGGLRGKNRDKVIEPTEFHLEKKVEDCADLLDGVFSHGPRILGDHWPTMAKPLYDYCSALILSQTPHTRENLQAFLAQRNIVSPPPQAKPQTLTLNLNIGGIEQPVTLALPDNLVNVALPDVNLNPEIKLAPEIKVSQPNITTPAPVVNLTNEVQTPEVTVNVEAPDVTVNNDVQTPEVNVAAPEVTVTPKVTADVKIPKPKPRKTRVIRDDEEKIIGTEEVE